MIKKFIDNKIIDVKAGLTTFPQPSNFLFCGIVFVTYVVCSLLVILYTKSFRWAPAYPNCIAAFLAFLPLTIHSFIEELAFRGMFIPHKSRRTARGKVLIISTIGIFIFVAWHPMMALFFKSSPQHIFMNPTFLAIVTLMAIANTLTYLKSGSLWMPIFIHWSTLFVWVYGFM